MPYGTAILLTSTYIWVTDIIRHVYWIHRYLPVQSGGWKYDRCTCALLVESKMYYKVCTQSVSQSILLLQSLRTTTS